MTGPLAGCTVGVTAARRAEELCALLERGGADVVHAPAIRIVPLADDEQLARATRECVRRPPDVVVATTGVGFRGWLSAAEGWGLADPLVEALRGAELVARGPKASGAVKAAGVGDAWSPESESSAGVLEQLLSSDPGGLRIAVQLHGEPLRDFVQALRWGGADVVEVPVYRWTGPADPEPLRRMVRAIAAGELDAVTFTSAPAAASLLATAGEEDVAEQVAEALGGAVLPACVGPVASGPLRERGINAVTPSRYRLGGLVRVLSEELPRRSVRLPVAGHELRLLGSAAVVDGEVRPIPCGGMTLLRELARRPGMVVGRGELLRALRDQGGSARADEHAVETAVARLRSALGEPSLVQTVVKRGYRLPVESLESRCAEEKA